MQAAAEPVGKAALASILGWSRPTLDRRLKSDAGFPVVSRGDQSGGWKFDLAAVKAHLGIEPAKPAKKVSKAAPAIDVAQLRDAVAQPPASVPSPAAASARRSAHHQGEATAKQRKDAADAALRENKLRVENAELIVAAEQRTLLAQLIASIGNDLDAIPDEAAKVLNCEDKAPVLRDLIDKVRIRMVQNAQPLLIEPPVDD
jgi:phage terminase Nu1 subunit (DNA packaging protein)